MAPSQSPIIIPPIATERAMIAFFSPLDFATAESTIPTGPRMIGKNRSEIPPQIIAARERAFPAVWAGWAAGEEFAK